MRVSTGMRSAAMSLGDVGVSAVEYVVLMGFVAAMALPMALAASTVWNSAAAVTAPTNRGPYSYPDGPVAGSTFTAQTLQGNGAYNYYGLVARNGFLSVQVSAFDPVHMVTGPVRSGDYTPGGMTAIYVPETGGTVFLGATLPGGTDPHQMNLRDMAKYPSSKSNWDCGC